MGTRVEGVTLPHSSEDLGGGTERDTPLSSKPLGVGPHYPLSPFSLFYPLCFGREGGAGIEINSYVAWACLVLSM